MTTPSDNADPKRRILEQAGRVAFEPGLERGRVQGFDLDRFVGRICVLKYEGHLLSRDGVARDSNMVGQVVGRASLRVFSAQGRDTATDVCDGREAGFDGIGADWLQLPVLDVEAVP